MRNVSKLLLIGGVLLVGFFVYYAYERNTSPETLPDREISFKGLRDLGGGEITLGQLKGKPFLVNIWATWCPYCRDEIPDFLKLAAEKENALTVVFVNRGEDAATVRNFFEKFSKISSTTVLLLDPDDAFYAASNGFSMPETLFVDKDGHIRYHKRGPMNLEEMRRRVEALFP